MPESLLERAVDRVQEVTGFTVQRTERVAQLRESEVEAMRWRDEAEDLAIRTMDYFGGRPQEMLPERRKRVAQRARIAFLTDPLGGREVELTADFVLGKGVPKPDSKHKGVQRIIDQTWNDPVNQENFFSYDAQRALLNDLKTQSNVCILWFERAGKSRFDFLDHDSVLSVVTDPEARRRALWYLAEERRFEWDFDQDRPSLQPQWEDGQLKKRYYEHWRNVEVAEEEREGRSEDALKKPKKEKMGEGKVYHVRTNRLGESMWGIPSFHRTLRFLSAMNQFVESRVAMAQAQASFIARRSVDGTPKQLLRQAGRLISQVGELGTAKIEGQSPEQAAAFGQGPPQTFPQGPVPPGSFLYENAAMKTEPLNLSSGGADAQANAQVIRGQWSAATGIGQHMAGDPSSTNLATATTLELPVTMMIQAWQKLISDIFEWLMDRAIEAAVAAGTLGGTGTTPGDKPLAEFRLWEADAVNDFEKDRDVDLSYEFQMPFPGRRSPTDVASLVEAALMSFDPDGINIPFRRTMLNYLLQQGFEIPDADSIVDAALPEPGEGGAQPFQNTVPPALAALLGLGAKGAAGGRGARLPAADPNASQYGEARKPTQPQDVRGMVRAELAEAVAQAQAGDGASIAAFVPEHLRPKVLDYLAANEEGFEAAVLGPARVAASGNGTGGE